MNDNISKNLLDYVTDGDLHTKLENVEYSTNLREVVTVGYMVGQAERGKCSHKEHETIEISGTDEAITVCHDCGSEL